MKKYVIAAALSAFAYGAPAGAQDRFGRFDERLARFEGGIGAQAFARVNNAAVPNDVQGVPSAGRPWVIKDLSATVRAGGSISVRGRGLLVAGGNGVGTNAGQSVHARLFCGAVAHNSATVPLDADGDFRIDGQLDPVPPADCATPVLLIVNGVAPAGAWFAAGIRDQR
jgi:hypothetical protein